MTIAPPFQPPRDLAAGTGAGNRVGVCLCEFPQASILTNNNRAKAGQTHSPSVSPAFLIDTLFTRTEKRHSIFRLK
jgi:hypothetical protein